MEKYSTPKCAHCGIVCVPGALVIYGNEGEPYHKECTAAQPFGKASASVSTELVMLRIHVFTMMNKLDKQQAEIRKLHEVLLSNGIKVDIVEEEESVL